MNALSLVFLIASRSRGSLNTVLPSNLMSEMRTGPLVDREDHLLLVRADVLDRVLGGGEAVPLLAVHPRSAP